MNSLFTPKQKQITALAKELLKYEQVEMPVFHHFTPGLYSREIHIPKGTFVISEVHKTRHPFVISRGVVRVWTESDGIRLFCAPHFGITEPGTRRMLLAETDLIWTTFHVTNKTNPKEIGDEILIRFADLPPCEQSEMEMIKEKLCHGLL